MNPSTSPIFGTAILFRHGESHANAGLPTADPGAIALTEKGHAQARTAAEVYDGAEPDLIVASPFDRARDTALPFVERFPTAAHEIWPIQEFTYLSLERCRNTTTTDRTAMAAHYWDIATPAYIDGDGAESYAQFRSRVDTFRNRLLAQPGTTLVFCHEIFIKALLWTPASPEDLERPLTFREYCHTFSIPNLGRIDFQDGQFTFANPAPPRL